MRNNERRNGLTHAWANFCQSEKSSVSRGGGFSLIQVGGRAVNRKDPKAWIVHANIDHLNTWMTSIFCTTRLLVLCKLAFCVESRQGTRSPLKKTGRILDIQILNTFCWKWHMHVSLHFAGARGYGSLPRILFITVKIPWMRAGRMELQVKRKLDSPQGGWKFSQGLGLISAYLLFFVTNGIGTWNFRCRRVCAK